MPTSTPRLSLAQDLRLEVEEGAQAELRGLEITGGVHDILLAADAQAKIIDCTVSSAKMGEGILLWNTARAEIAHSTISGNGSTGISLTHSTWEPDQRQ
jgi:parallel beta-helix repeat protein